MLTREQVYSILLSTGLPVAYRAFREDEEVDLPIIVYEEGTPNVFSADGIPYYVSPTYDIQLQEWERDLDAENSISNALLTHGLFFSKSEPSFNDSEKFYSINYNVEV